MGIWNSHQSSPNRCCLRWHCFHWARILGKSAPDFHLLIHTASRNPPQTSHSNLGKSLAGRLESLHFFKLRCVFCAQSQILDRSRLGGQPHRCTPLRVVQRGFQFTALLIQLLWHRDNRWRKVLGVLAMRAERGFTENAGWILILEGASHQELWVWNLNEGFAVQD